MKRHELRILLANAGITPRRASGQNFLVEENLADAIARDGGIQPEDVVLEIGTGIGILTSRLLEPAHHVVSVEMDARVLELARGELGQPDNLTLIEADALANKNEINPVVLEALREHLGSERRLRVVANLPYAVATPLVIGLLSCDLPLDRMVVMVQLEAAQRFGAVRGEEGYGAVSIVVSALASEVTIVRKVPRDVFMPRPKVTSAVARITPREDRHQGFERLSSVVRALFNYRRKTLSKAIKAVTKQGDLLWLPAALETSGIDPKRRPDDLQLGDFQTLAGIRHKVSDE